MVSEEYEQYMGGSSQTVQYSVVFKIRMKANLARPTLRSLKAELWHSSLRVDQLLLQFRKQPPNRPAALLNLLYLHRQAPPPRS